MAAEVRRSPDALPITLFGGTEHADLLKRYRDMGVERVVTTFPPESAEKTLPVLDRWADVESSARDRWEQKNPGTWEKFRESIKHAWVNARAK